MDTSFYEYHSCHATQMSESLILCLGTTNATRHSDHLSNPQDIIPYSKLDVALVSPKLSYHYEFFIYDCEFQQTIVKYPPIHSNINTSKKDSLDSHQSNTMWQQNNYLKRMNQSVVKASCKTRASQDSLQLHHILSTGSILVHTPSKLKILHPTPTGALLFQSSLRELAMDRELKYNSHECTIELPCLNAIMLHQILSKWPADISLLVSFDNCSYDAHFYDQISHLRKKLEDSIWPIVKKNSNKIIALSTILIFETYQLLSEMCKILLSTTSGFFIHSDTVGIANIIQEQLKKYRTPILNAASIFSPTCDDEDHQLKEKDVNLDQDISCNLESKYISSSFTPAFDRDLQNNHCIMNKLNSSSLEEKHCQVDRNLETNVIARKHNESISPKYNQSTRLKDGYQYGKSTLENDQYIFNEKVVTGHHLNGAERNRLSIGHGNTSSKSSSLCKSTCKAHNDHFSESVNRFTGNNTSNANITTSSNGNASMQTNPNKLAMESSYYGSYISTLEHQQTNSSYASNMNLEYIRIHSFSKWPLGILRNNRIWINPNENYHSKSPVKMTKNLAETPANQKDCFYNFKLTSNDRINVEPPLTTYNISKVSLGITNDPREIEKELSNSSDTQVNYPLVLPNPTDPTLTNPYATPYIMAKAGFYFQPDVIVTNKSQHLEWDGLDTCCHFHAPLNLSNWAKLDHPCAELQRHFPSDPFVQHFETNNIPLAYTLAIFEPIEFSSYKIKQVTLADYAPLAAVILSHGEALICDLSVEINPLFSVNLFSGERIEYYDFMRKDFQNSLKCEFDASHREHINTDHEHDQNKTQPLKSKEESHEADNQTRTPTLKEHLPGSSHLDNSTHHSVDGMQGSIIDLASLHFLPCQSRSPRASNLNLFSTMRSMKDQRSSLPFNALDQSPQLQASNTLQEHGTTWCSQGIEVFIEKGPHQGNHGVIRQLLSQSNVLIFVYELDDLIQTPIHSISPNRPTSGQYARCLYGPYMGYYGKVIVIHDNFISAAPSNLSSHQDPLQNKPKDQINVAEPKVLSNPPDIGFSNINESSSVIESPSEKIAIVVLDDDSKRLRIFPLNHLASIRSNSMRACHSPLTALHNGSCLLSIFSRPNMTIYKCYQLFDNYSPEFLDQIVVNHLGALIKTTWVNHSLKLISFFSHGKDQQQQHADNINIASWSWDEQLRSFSNCKVAPFFRYDFWREDDQILSIQPIKLLYKVNGDEAIIMIIASLSAHGHLVLYQVDEDVEFWRAMNLGQDLIEQGYTEICPSNIPTTSIQVVGYGGIKTFHVLDTEDMDSNTTGIKLSSNNKANLNAFQLLHSNYKHQTTLPTNFLTLSFAEYFNNFNIHPVPFHCYPPPNIRQVDHYTNKIIKFSIPIQHFINYYQHQGQYISSLLHYQPLHPPVIPQTLITPPCFNDYSCEFNSPQFESYILNHSNASTYTFTFEIEIPRVSRIDNINFEFGMSEAWLGIEKETNLFSHRYLLSVHYYPPLWISETSNSCTTKSDINLNQNGIYKSRYILAIDKFDLTGVIFAGHYADHLKYSHPPSCTLNLDHVFTKRLLVNLDVQLQTHSSLYDHHYFSKLLNEQRKTNSQAMHADHQNFFYKKVKSFKRRFEYTHDFDEYGLLYWIGTKGLKEPWKNPMDMGLVNIILSHDKFFSHEMKSRDIISRKPTQSTYWGGSAPQWFIIDLGPDLSLNCTAYTVLHGYQYNNSFLQYWTFSGSNDTKNWVILDQGTEPLFTKGFESKTFMVKNGKEHYRYFRLLQTGNYSMGTGKVGSPYICIGGFELYGELHSNDFSFVPMPNIISDITLKLMMLKPSFGLSIEQTRAHCRAITESTEFHQELLKTCCNWVASPQLRILCLDLLINAWKIKMVQTAQLLFNIDLKEFIRRNIVKADRVTVSKCSFFLICCINSDELIRKNHNLTNLAHASAVSHDHIISDSALHRHKKSQSSLREVDGHSSDIPSWIGAQSSLTSLVTSNDEKLIARDRIENIATSTDIRSNLLSSISNEPCKNNTFDNQPSHSIFGSFSPKDLYFMPTNAVDIRSKILDCLLKMLSSIADEIDNKHGLGQIIILLSKCWPKNPENAHMSVLKVLIDLSRKMYNLRSPFYNLLRTHFDLYDFPLELNVFVKADPIHSISPREMNHMLNKERNAPYSISSTSSNEPFVNSHPHLAENQSQNFPSTAICDTSNPMQKSNTTNNKKQVLKSSNPTENLNSLGLEFMNEKDLQNLLLQISLEFGLKQRALTTLLEEITILGDSFSNHKDEVIRVYNECILAQNHYHRIHNKLKNLSLTYNYYESDDTQEDLTSLSRWNAFVEEIMIFLNVQDDDLEHEISATLLFELFSNLVVYGTPVQRRETTHYLISHLTTQTPFPATILKLFFSKKTDLSRPINLFPQQVVFDILQEIMAQDKLRFFYVDNLFLLLEEETSLQQFELRHYGRRLPRFSSSNSTTNIPRSCIRIFGSHQSRIPSKNCEGDVTPSLSTTSDANSTRNLIESTSKTLPLLSHQNHTSISNMTNIKLVDKKSCKCNITANSVVSNSNNNSNNNEDETDIDESTIDLPLVSWLLLLLSNTMARTNDNAPVHKGSKCRSCNMSPISGVRYRCVNCIDYDLCETCELDCLIIHNKSHLFLKIPSVLPLLPNNFNFLSLPKEPLLPVLYNGFIEFPSPNMAEINQVKGSDLHHGSFTSNNKKHDLSPQPLNPSWITAPGSKQNTAQKNIFQPSSPNNPLYGGNIHSQTPTTTNTIIPSNILKNEYNSIQLQVQCDGCRQKDIQGIYFKCVHCDKFNLCNGCEGKVEHYPLHLFLKIRYPLPLCEEYTKPLIPVLLHHGFYTSSSFKVSQQPPISLRGVNHKLHKSVDISFLKKEELKELEENSDFPTQSRTNLRSSFKDISDLNDDNNQLQPISTNININSNKTNQNDFLLNDSLISSHKTHNHHPLVDSEHHTNSSSDYSSSLLNRSAIDNDLLLPCQAFDDRHLRSIFTVILISARVQVLGPELFLLAMRVLEGLTTQYTPDNISQDIFKHPHFDDFLRQVSSYPSSFIRSAVLQMIDKLVDSSAYIVSKEGAQPLKRIRTLLRSKVIKLLRETEYAPNNSSVQGSDNFFLELLLVVTSDKDIIKSEGTTLELNESLPSSSTTRKRKKKRKDSSRSNAVNGHSVRTDVIKSDHHRSLGNMHKGIKGKVGRTNNKPVNIETNHQHQHGHRCNVDINKIPYENSVLNSIQSRSKTTTRLSENRSNGNTKLFYSSEREHAHLLNQFNKTKNYNIKDNETNKNRYASYKSSNQGSMKACSSSWKSTWKSSTLTASPLNKNQYLSCSDASQLFDAPKRFIDKKNPHLMSRRLIPFRSTGNDDEYPIDSIANYLLSFLAQSDEMPLGSNAAARTWCMVFRLLLFANPSHVGRLPHLMQAIRQALQAPEELQVLLVDDFIALMNMHLEQPVIGPQLQVNIFSEMVQVFPQVYAEDNTLAFSRLLQVMHINFDPNLIQFKIEDLAILLQAVADSLPEMQSTTNTKDDPQNYLLKQLLDWFNMVLTAPTFTNYQLRQLIVSAIDQKEKAFSYIFVSWLSQIEPKSKQKASATLRKDDKLVKALTTGTATLNGDALSLPKNLTPSVFDLGRAFTRLIKILARDDFSSKHFLNLALSTLCTKADSVLLAELCLSLIKTEELAFYFMIRLNGIDFFLEQIKSSNTRLRSSFLSPAFAAMLSFSAKGSGKSILKNSQEKHVPTKHYSGIFNQHSQVQDSSQFYQAKRHPQYHQSNNQVEPSRFLTVAPINIKHMKNHFENLSAVTKLLRPREGEQQLERLLKESSSTNSNVVWTYNYCPNSLFEERLTLEMAIPDNVILREIRIDCINNHNNVSRFPASVTIETGTSLSRMLPVGCFHCKPDSQYYRLNKNMRQTVTFKFPLPDIKVVKFVQLHIQCPKQSSWIALSRIQLLGHSSLLYNAKDEEDGSTDPLLLLSQLPLSTSLDILEKTLKFSRVHLHMVTKLKLTTSQLALALLNILSKSTSSTVQNILSYLAHHDTFLSDLLLDHLLDEQTTYHAAIAGRICALGDEQTCHRLEKLFKFVFKEIESHTDISLSAHLVPFLDALSEAISVNIRKDLSINCIATEEQIKTLFGLAINSLEGSLMQQGALRLLSSLIQRDPDNYSILLTQFILGQFGLNKISLSSCELNHLLLHSDKQLQSIINTLGLLATSSSRAAQRLLCSNLPQRLIYLVKTVLSYLKGFENQCNMKTATTSNFSTDTQLEIDQLSLSSNSSSKSKTENATHAHSSFSTLSFPMSSLLLPSSSNVVPQQLLSSSSLETRPRCETAGYERFLEFALSFFARITYEPTLKHWIGYHAFHILFDICLNRDFGSLSLYAIQVLQIASNMNPINQEIIASYLNQQIKLNIQENDHFTSSLQAKMSGLDQNVLIQYQTHLKKQSNLNDQSSINPSKHSESINLYHCPTTAIPKSIQLSTTTLDHSSTYPPKSTLHSISSSTTTCSSINDSIHREVIACTNHLSKTEILLQHMVNMLVIEDHAIICLHSKNGQYDIKALLPNTVQNSSDMLRLDRNNHHPGIDLSEDALEATANAKKLIGWRTVVAEKPIRNGVHNWEVVLEKLTSSANLMIGVCERNHSLNAYIGQNHIGKGWSYYGAMTGYTFHDGKSDSQYGQKMIQGDVIGVCLDMDEGTISFTRNKENLGIAFDNLSDKELYLAISLYDVGDRIKLQPLQQKKLGHDHLARARISGNIPLTYHRTSPLFSLPITTTWKDISTSLIGHIGDKSVSFEYLSVVPKEMPNHSSPTSSSICLGSGNKEEIKADNSQDTVENSDHSSCLKSEDKHHENLVSPSNLNEADTSPPVFIAHNHSDIYNSHHHYSQILEDREVSYQLIPIDNLEQTIGNTIKADSLNGYILDIYFRTSPSDVTNALITLSYDLADLNSNLSRQETDIIFNTSNDGQCLEFPSSIENEDYSFGNDIFSHAHFTNSTKSKPMIDICDRKARKSQSIRDWHLVQSIKNNDLLIKRLALIGGITSLLHMLQKQLTLNKLMHQAIDLYSSLNCLTNNNYINKDNDDENTINSFSNAINTATNLTNTASNWSSTNIIDKDGSYQKSGLTGADNIHGTLPTDFPSGIPQSTTPLDESSPSPGISPITHGLSKNSSTNVDTFFGEGNMQDNSPLPIYPACDLLSKVGISFKSQDSLVIDHPPSSCSTEIDGNPIIFTHVHDKSIQAQNNQNNFQKSSIYNNMNQPIGLDPSGKKKLDEISISSSSSSLIQSYVILSHPKYEQRWHVWLALLQLTLGMDNFQYLFLDQSDCRSLLFKLMKDLQRDVKGLILLSRSYIRVPLHSPSSLSRGSLNDSYFPPTTPRNGATLSSSNSISHTEILLNITNNTSSNLEHSIDGNHHNKKMLATAHDHRSEIDGNFIHRANDGLSAGDGGGVGLKLSSNIISPTSCSIASPSYDSLSMTSSKVPNAVTKFDLSELVVPSTSSEILANPTRLIYSTLLTLLRSSQVCPKRSLLMRNQLYESGVLGFLLAHLSVMCNHVTSDVQDPHFQNAFDLLFRCRHGINDTNISSSNLFSLTKMDQAQHDCSTKSQLLSTKTNGPHAAVSTTQSKSPESGVFWAKGTGFGTASDDKIPSTWSYESYIKQQLDTANKIAFLFEIIYTYLEVPLGHHPPHEPRFHPLSRGDPHLYTHFPKSWSQEHVSDMLCIGGSDKKTISLKHEESIDDDQDGFERDSDSDDYSSFSVHSQTHSSSFLSTSPRLVYPYSVEDSIGQESDGEDSVPSFEDHIMEEMYNMGQDQSQHHERQINNKKLMWTKSVTLEHPILDQQDAMTTMLDKQKYSDSSIDLHEHAHLHQSHNDGNQSMDSYQHNQDNEYGNNVAEDWTQQQQLPNQVYKLMEDCGLFGIIESHLRNDSLIDMARHLSLYIAIFKTTSIISTHVPLAIKLIGQSTAGPDNNIYTLIKNLYVMSKIVLERLPKAYLHQHLLDDSQRLKTKKNLSLSSHCQGTNSQHHPQFCNTSSPPKYPDGSETAYPSPLAKYDEEMIPSNHLLSCLPELSEEVILSKEIQHTYAILFHLKTIQEEKSHSLLNQSTRVKITSNNLVNNICPSRSSLPSLLLHHASEQEVFEFENPSKFTNPWTSIEESLAFNHSQSMEKEKYGDHLELEGINAGPRMIRQDHDGMAPLKAMPSSWKTSKMIGFHSSADQSNEVPLRGEEAAIKASKLVKPKRRNDSDKQVAQLDDLGDEQGKSGQYPAHSSSTSPSSSLQLVDEYVKLLTPLQFDEVDMFDRQRQQYSSHYHVVRIKQEVTNTIKKTKRLIQELSSLTTSLPLFYESSIFLRVDTQRMDVFKCIITGPEDTPYANGCFLFNIYCPAEYPSLPPLVALQTTGGGTVRFNPNLYNCGKVCLSLIGTWKGTSNEKWNEETTTLLQVLVSIQSLIFVANPFFNEPGLESLMNTPQGEIQGREYNQEIRKMVIKWAIIDQILHPPPEFREVIHKHFKIKRARILQLVHEWLEQATTTATSKYVKELSALINELEQCLDQL